MKLTAAVLALAGSATAFAPSKVAKTSSALNSLNGWTPDANKFAYGLPGAIPPFEEGHWTICHLDEVRAISPAFFKILAIIIGSFKLNRAIKGWAAPTSKTIAGSGTLKDDYYPGDIGFDPLNLKPDDPAAFAEMNTKELQNGRLAMLGIAGMVTQELVNGKEIFVKLGLTADRFDPSSVPIQF